MLVKGIWVGALVVRILSFSNVGSFPGDQDRIMAKSQYKLCSSKVQFQYQILWTTAYLLPFREEVFFTASTVPGK